MSGLSTTGGRYWADGESGFTLIELLVLIIIIGILVAMGIPSYLAYKDHANKSAARANVRSLIPSLDAFNAANHGMATGGARTVSYRRLTIALLKDEYNSAIDASKYAVVTRPGVGTSCITSRVGRWTAWKENPGGGIRVARAGDSSVCD